MHARLTQIQGAPDQLDAAIEMAKTRVLPTLQGLDGYKGFTVAVDRGSGKMFGISFFDSEETLRASDEAVRAVREETAEAAGGSPEVSFYEVVIDDEA